MDEVRQRVAGERCRGMRTGRIYEYDLENAADAELQPRPAARQLLKDLSAAQRAKVDIQYRQALC